MFRLFYKPNSNVNYGTINSPLVPRIKNLVDDHLNYQLYLNSISSSYVPNTNILITLASVLDIYLGRYVNTYSVVQSNIQRICSELGITSSYTYGRVHTNQIYTKNCILLSTTYSDQIIIQDWKTITAIKCLNHNMFSMDIFIPPTQHSQLIDGLTVLGIDIPLFAYQLKKFTEYNNTLPIGEQESIGIFISKYVLPNIIHSYLDIAFRNRLKYVYSNTPVPNNMRHERSWALSYTDALENSVLNVLKMIMTTRTHYIRGLSEIPMVYNSTYLSAVPMEAGVLSNYSYWVTFIIFVDWFYAIIDFITDEQVDSSNIRKTLIKVNRLLNSGWMPTRYMPEDVKINLFKKYKVIQDKFLI